MSKTPLEEEIQKLRDNIAKQGIILQTIAAMAKMDHETCLKVIPAVIRKKMADLDNARLPSKAPDVPQDGRTESGNVRCTLW